MFEASLVDSGYQTILVEKESFQRTMVSPKRITYNKDGGTIVQYGTSYMVWSGYLAFDNATQRDFLRSLAFARTFYINDNTQGGRTSEKVYWTGNFNPRYDTNDMESGSVAFEFHSVGST